MFYQKFGVLFIHGVLDSVLFFMGSFTLQLDIRAKSVRKMSTLFVLALKMYSNFNTQYLISRDGAPEPNEAKLLTEP